jgi:AbrB family looped-hinge helix DNA binding protein
MSTVSRLTRKCQTTIPKDIRDLLHVKAGDLVAFEAKGDVVTVRKATALDVEYLRSVESTLTEWASAADDEAYRGL